MNTEERDERERRMARFLETETGKAFFRFKMAFVRVRRTVNGDDDTQSDDHYQALQEMAEAEDRLMELSEGEWREYEVPFWRRSPIPGQRIVMRRFIEGAWEYRPMRDEESANTASAMVW